MVHLILTGATGLVGGCVLHRMLHLETVTKISILSRRPVPQAEGHAKAHTIIHKDFGSYNPGLLEKLRGAEGCVWAQGTSVNNVSKSDYVVLTHDYPVAAAKAFSTLHDKFKFVYVSGEGTTTNPSMFTPYFGVIKGRAEASLLSLSEQPEYASLQPYSVRPGAVDASEHSEVHSYIPKNEAWTKTAGSVLMPVLRATWSSMVSPTRDMSQVFVDLAMGDGEPIQGVVGVDGEGRTLSNKAIRTLAGI